MALFFFSPICVFGVRYFGTLGGALQAILGLAVWSDNLVLRPGGGEEPFASRN